MRWVHHANRIQDDLRKSSVFLFKNNTYVTTGKHLYDHLCLCFKNITSSIVQILIYNHLCFLFSYPLQTIAKGART